MKHLCEQCFDHQKTSSRAKWVASRLSTCSRCGFLRNCCDMTPREGEGKEPVPQEKCVETSRDDRDEAWRKIVMAHDLILSIMTFRQAHLKEELDHLSKLSAAVEDVLGAGGPIIRHHRRIHSVLGYILKDSAETEKGIAKMLTEASKLVKVPEPAVPSPSSTGTFKDYAVILWYRMMGIHPDTTPSRLPSTCRTVRADGVGMAVLKAAAAMGVAVQDIRFINVDDHAYTREEVGLS